MAKKETVLSVLKDIRNLLKPDNIRISVDLPKGERFIKNSDGIVLDNETKLMWGPTLGKEMNWDDAIKVCKEFLLGGYKDWRLPTIRELISIIDYSKREPAIDTGIFPDTKSSWYWSGTPVAGLEDGAWIVRFYGGRVRNFYKSFGNYVRPCRVSQ